MEHLYLGNSGLRVSRLSLGTMSWGTEVSEETAREQLSTFIAADGTCIETGPHYGAEGAEPLLAEVIAETTPREDIILSVSTAPIPTDPHGPVDASRLRLLNQLEASLSRLRTDYLDLWSVPLNRHTPVEETLSCLEYAHTSGKARYVGLVSDVGWLATRAASLSRIPVVSVSTEYSLLRRHVEYELLDALDILTPSLRVWSPLAYGALTGKYVTGKTPALSRAADPAWDASMAQYLDERSLRVIEAVLTAANGLNVDPETVALAWLLEKPSVAQVVVGARNTAQLKNLISGANVHVPQEILAVLDEVSLPSGR